MIQEKYSHMNHNFMGINFQVFNLHNSIFPKIDMPENSPVFFPFPFALPNCPSLSLPYESKQSPLSQTFLSCITPKEGCYITPGSQAVSVDFCNINIPLSSSYHHVA